MYNILLIDEWIWHGDGARLLLLSFPRPRRHCCVWATVSVHYRTPGESCDIRFVFAGENTTFSWNRHGSRDATQRSHSLVRETQQIEIAEDNRSRRRDGWKDLHAHHLHDQTVSYRIRAHRVSVRLRARVTLSVIIMNISYSFYWTGALVVNSNCY